MVTCAGPLATTSCEPRQARKGAAVAADSGAGVWLVQVTTLSPAHKRNTGEFRHNDMSYQVLARKWRPRNFSEVVGQEHVLKALINALDQNRLHHGFLFTGTRGVGKTTLARILAKSLNCETGVSSRPCGECSACREIDEGRFVDLIEVDAASRTKVEDTRDLLENVQYAPTRGRYKVYLIDEVHMLSNASFNALLKTLEEPPPHIKFLLATTDPQKLPATILSRCLQFNLKRLSQKAIQGQLERILEQEQIAYDSSATQAVAKAADGSMRDALSLLDQAIAHCGGKLGERETHAMLGTIDRRYIFALLQAIADNDGAALYSALQDLETYNPDYQEALNELNSALHRIALTQVLDAGAEDGDDDGARIRGLAQQLSAEDVQLLYQIGILGRRDLPLAPDPHSGLEMTLLRMLAFRPLAAQAAATPDNRQPGAVPPRDVPSPVARGPAGGAGAAVGTSAAATGNWQQIVSGLQLTGLAQQLALNCRYLGQDDKCLRLELDPQHGHLFSDKLRQRLQETLNRHSGKDLRLDISIGKSTLADTPAALASQRQQQQQAAAEQEVAGNAHIKALQEAFGASVDQDSIKPI